MAFTGDSAQQVHNLTAKAFIPGRLLTKPYHPPLAVVAPTKSATTAKSCKAGPWLHDPNPRLH